MQKWIILILLCLFVGCQEGNDTYTYEEQPDSTYIYDQADYFHYKIESIHSMTLEIAPIIHDGDASYAAFEVTVNKNTMIEGEKTSFSALVVGDKVNIWLASDHIASKIQVK